MARVPQDVFSHHADSTHTITLDASSGSSLTLPGNEFVADANILRDGQDLILRAPNGSEVVVQNYFSTEHAPMLISADGAALTPELVDSFVKSVDGAQFAQNGSMDDESPVGMIKETTGDATITHPDGTIVHAAIGTPIYQGDVVETQGNGAVNITFVDETTFAVSENARLSIDEYVFDPASQSGENSFSVLRGVFVFTSGLIGREDPDDVHIDTPVGSIGIRGTTIMGTINPNGDSQITVVEGAIVVRNGSGEQTLSQQFETVRMAGFDSPMSNEGQLSNQQITESYNVLRSVSAPLFSSFEDNSAKEGQPADTSTPAEDGSASDASEQAPDDATPATDGSETADPANGDDGAQLTPAPAADQPVITATADAGFDTSASIDSKPVLTAQPSMVSTTIAPPPAPAFSAPPPPAATMRSPGQTLPPPPNVINGGGGVTPPAWDLNLNDVISGANTTKVGFIQAPGGTTDWLHGANVLGLGVDQHHAFTTAYDLYIHTPTPTSYSLSAYGIASTENHSVSYVGDMNGDGIGDLILGSPDDNKVVLIDGSDPNNFVNINGFVGGSDAGYSVAGLGDFNGDGYNDVAFSAPNLIGGPSKLFVMYGDASTFLSASFSLTALTPGIANITDPEGFYLTESASTVHMGQSVTGLQDFNNDGYSDFAVTKTGLNSVSIYMGHTGNAYEFTNITNGAGMDGESGVISLGDLNGGHSTDLGIYESGTNTLHILYGEGTYNTSQDINAPIHGRITSSAEMIGGGAVGDFNGDGLDDLAIATRTGDKADVYVVYGKAGGMVNYNLQNLTDAQGFHMHLDLNSPQFNLANPATDDIDISISTMGDRNGDGLDDMLIGIPNIDNDGDSSIHSDSGGVMVIDGRYEASDLTSGRIQINNPQASMNGQTLIDTLGPNTLSDFDGTTVFSNLNINAGSGNDTIYMYNSTQRVIDGGAGIDKLDLLSGANIDLRLMGNNLKSVEIIDYKASSQSVTIGIDDIFRLMQESDDGRLVFNTIYTGNTLQIDSNGTDNDGNTIPDTTMAGLGFTGGTDNGAGYTEWYFQSYTLLVDNDINAGTPAVANV